MRIVFSPHAENKLHLLRDRGFPVTRDEVLDCIKKPDTIKPGYGERKVAQRAFDATHVLRVIYSEIAGEKRIITFYPGRRERYED